MKTLIGIISVSLISYSLLFPEPVFSVSRNLYDRNRDHCDHPKRPTQKPKKANEEGSFEGIEEK